MSGSKPNPVARGYLYGELTEALSTADTALCVAHSRSLSLLTPTDVAILRQAMNLVEGLQQRTFERFELERRAASTKVKSGRKRRTA